MKLLLLTLFGALAHTLIGMFVVAAFAQTPPTPLPLTAPHQQCPTGWRESFGACVPNGPTAKPAIPRSGHACPSGWRQSGSFCIQN